MAQPSVAAFFSNRKRAALDDATTIKTRVSVHDHVGGDNMW